MAVMVIYRCTKIDKSFLQNADKSKSIKKDMLHTYHINWNL